MTAIQGARERARREVTTAIMDEARRRLAVDGAAKLSLRAVARELGMVSSALYRYFPSRDDLLTALIVEAYDALGEAAEGALEAAPRSAPAERWVAVCAGVRAWALAHPHEFALIHGTPVPGYAAPPDTNAPGGRVPFALARVAREAVEDGLLGPVPGGPLPEPLAREAAALVAEHAPGVPAPAMAAVVASWAQLVGLVGFEVFGQFTGVIERSRAELFTHQARRLAEGAGLPPRQVPPH
ncbi:TetR/AcrR family transcriptional regulator [Streptomyces radicis]|uniref:TetR/AcrR family transcriptional regulator n=1 Tax=Streptomyces radicis TaxID=1750517 RepID=A0A3A9WF74_9ACTN|nr:TetR/AcrR family transcriptional regulator [Streptomyces radicis]RKN11961.1 TetR/AcrR family transcriptional regulator [Streptomyces radicis]RKN25988.1 TetR/AcrR family transcriptional regulator [Streptomyces radicis]